LVGDDVVAGRAATRIRCTDRGLDLWLDRATLLVLRIEAGDHTPDWQPGAGLSATSIELPQVVDPEAFALAAPTGALPEGTPTGLKVGSPLPTWSGTTLDGATTGSDETRGHPQVVVIWAAWCQPCIDQLPWLSDLSVRDDVKLVTIAFTSDAAAAHAALPSAGPSFPVVVDKDGSIGDQFGVNAVPVIVFVDAGGTVRGFETGQLTAEQLGQATDDLVAGRPLELPRTP
jgi:thiol-disulfide isomerase/thioredoxin